MKESLMNAAPTSIAVFEFLDRTHQDIQRQLQQLHGIMAAIEAQDLSAKTRAELRTVIDFFNGEARQHHLDEEKHVFPALLNSQDEKVVHAAEHLTQDHGWLEENWLMIEPSLEAAANGNQWFDPAELRHSLGVFEALYLDHILLEESIAYPEAQKRLEAYDMAGMGREMARRRTLKLAEGGAPTN
jgi:hemerythrin-like domain-containing protein